MKVNRSNQDGFTIIETLIVLGIAGLIMLITFMAIPAVQRSSQNNERKQDVELILSDVSHYELNNSGNFPPLCDGAHSTCNTLSGMSNLNGGLKFYSYSFIGMYPGSGTGADGASYNSDFLSPAHTGDPTSREYVQILNYYKCLNGSGSTPETPATAVASTQAAGYNDIVAFYDIQTGSNTFAMVCQQL